MPAAAEVERDGVGHGELNRVLLQKGLKKLNRYIIDLQKQIKELKNK